MKKLWKIISVIIIVALLPQLSCDDREPEDTADDNYELILYSAVPVYGDDEAKVVVGEDVVGSIRTQLKFKLQDKTTSVPVSGKLISFTAKRLSLDYGTFSINSDTTKVDGIVEVYYTDGQDGGAVDNPETQDFDGVTVTAEYVKSDNIRAFAEFNVYAHIDSVWPYTLNLNADPEEIELSDGSTKSTIHLELENLLEEPVKYVNVYFSSNIGTIKPDSITNGEGEIYLEFEDDGHAGDAIITASYTHPSNSEQETGQVTVTIGTNYNFTMSAYHLSNNIAVGEDVVSDDVITHVEGTLTNGIGNPVAGEWIYFTSHVNNVPYGTFSNDSALTNSSGVVSTIYSDGGGDGAINAPGTFLIFEGVTIEAEIAGEDTETQVQFNVYPSLDDVWPYELDLYPDPAEIMLDNGLTTSEITFQLDNFLGDPVIGVSIDFPEPNKGNLLDSNNATTDSTGSISLIFEDRGQPEDIGQAVIIAQFTHPGVPETILDSVFVSIDVDYIISLTAYPVALELGTDVNVGEDIVGDIAMTKLIVHVTTNDTSGSSDPVRNIGVNLTPMDYLGNTVGTITMEDSLTGPTGRIFAYYHDENEPYINNPGTDEFDIWEGITVEASLTENTTATVEFNVYPESQVWPYTLTLIPPETTVVYLDEGETIALIKSRLTNNDNLPVSNISISFSAVLGSITTSALTDSAGIAEVTYSDLGFYPPDTTTIWVDIVTASYTHPGFETTLTDTTSMTIEDISFSTCAFIEIPPSNPDHIVVRDGGGIESTQIKAEIYDDDNNLMNTPTPVTFRLNPVLSECYLDEEGQTEVTVYTVDGIASVSVNSGIWPGVVRIEVEVDCDEDGEVDLSAASDQVIISSGAPYYIEPEYDPNSTTPTGGGFYQTQCAAIVYDIWYNPVEDSTYVYWTIEPTPPDTLINAFVDGVSFTGNENLDGGSYSGMAFTTIVYSTDAIGDIGYVSATTYGANGDTITARINEDVGESLLFFLPGQLTLTASAYYHDFTLPVATDEVEIQITAMLIDYYGNAVSEAPIAFNGVGVSEWREIGYENYTDGGGGFEADGCFSWRDYGLDDDPGTLDEGEGNDDHDAFDPDGDGVIDTSEVSEPFDDFGLDGLPDTNDEGEGNGEWDGYHMIDCGPTVRTDQDGIARITAVFPKELCIWLSQDPNTELNFFQEFSASLTGTLLIPQQITSDPITIQLVRSPTTEGGPP